MSSFNTSVAETTIINTEEAPLSVEGVVPVDNSAECTTKSLETENQTGPLEIKVRQSDQDPGIPKTIMPGQSASQDIIPGQVPVENHAQGCFIPQFVQAQMEESPQSQMGSIATQVSPVHRVSPQISPTDDRSPEGTDGHSGPVKKTKRRGSAWTDDQTYFLMEVWARHTDASGNEEYSVTNAPIYRIISRSMSELGYIDKTSDQCKCRIHTLKRAYKLTKAEIDSGAQNITFCRHYDKLKIIMGDDPTMTPKQLAEVLAEQRRTKGLTVVSSEATPKKLKPSPDHKLKRALTAESGSQDKTPPKQTYKPAVQTPAVPQVPPLPAVSSLWNHQSLTFPFVVTPPIQSQSVTYTENQYSSPVNTQSISYQNTAETTSSNSSYDINHNTNVVVKQEKLEDGYPIYQPFIQKANEAVSQTKEEIERMRLDLEIKKIEMERNRLEMEERQRREDRDHQYRMMQLLLMGLGHNPTLGSPGQGSETEETHQPELSRALEGGLVPGGAQCANEKGLSFSEI